MSLPSNNLWHLRFLRYSPVKLYRSRSLRQGQIKVTPWCCTPTPHNQCSYQISTSYTLRFPRYSPDKILKVKIQTTRQKVKSRSHHDIAHLQPLTYVPATYQLPTPYSCWDIARTRYSNSRSRWQGQVKSRSDHDVAHLQPLTNIPSTYELPTPYSFWDIARTNFSRCPPAWTPWVKTIFQQPLRVTLGHHGWKQYPDRA